ncbi:MAG: LptF/LptG family permease [candidate division WOR-3 bacterium]
MKIIDRHLVKQLIKFAFLALLSVVTIYLLIDLFEELGYFTSRKVTFLVLVRHYFYSLPAAIVLLYPVSLVLAVFMVYGQMTRHNEIAALKSAGVVIYRLFVPAVAVAGATILLYAFGYEFITIRFNQRLSDLRRYVIEKRGNPAQEKCLNVYRMAKNRALWVRELGFPAFGKGVVTMRNFTIIELDRNRRVLERIDGDSAIYQGGSWVGFGLIRRVFPPTGIEEFQQIAQSQLNLILGTPEEWFTPPRPVEETPTAVLRNYINQMKAAGENVAQEEVEYHYRFSYALIGLVVVLLGLPFSVKLRQRGGVMFGLGLGLLFSFIYWGAIQTCRAFGTSHVISPGLAAWLPNIIFGLVAFFLLLKIEK